ncbi:MAG: hypothetical protein ABIN58_07735 [candidate division WOR-3 bacterium]
MPILRSERFDGMKFMQDGRVYDSKAEAEKAMEEYRNAGFDVRLLEEDGKFLVFSRRVVKEVKVEP